MTKNITPLSWVVDSIGATTQTTSNIFTLTKKGKVTAHLMKYMELDTQDHIITFTKFANTCAVYFIKFKLLGLWHTKMYLILFLGLI